MVIRSLVLATSSALALSGPVHVQSMDAKIFLHPDRLVAVSGARRLNLLCRGDGRPTVILISGGGQGAVQWRFVQRQLVRLARVCAYDRPGFGHSDPATREQDVDGAVDDLRRLLDAAHIPKPVVLVGHSLGGLYAITYASRRPHDVAGLVLLDAYVPGQYRREAAVMSDTARAQAARAAAFAEKGQNACLEFAEHWEITRATRSECLDDLDPPDKLLQAELDRQEASATYQRAARSEVRSADPHDPAIVANDEREVRFDRSNLGNLPLVVIGSGNDFHLKDTAAEAALAAVDRQDMANLAARSHRGRLIFLPKAGHDLPNEAPEAVISAVRDVLKQAREARP